MSAGAVLRRVALVGATVFGAELVCAYMWPASRQSHFDASLVVGTRERDTLRVVALGDSTLTAPGLHQVDDVWIRRVMEDLAAATGRSVSLVSLGAGGATTRDVLRDQLPAALAEAPHLALVSVGANDLIRGVSLRRMERHLDSVVGRLCESGARVVLSGVGDLGSIPRLAPPLRQMASRLGRRGDQVHAIVAERHGATKADQWRWAAQEFRIRKDVWSTDRFHPNAAGHAIWARTCWEAVSPLCAGLAEP